MELLTIGAFARASRLSPKALRLYDELGLLAPARVDPSSGYRYYAPGQLERARLVAWLRRIGMPLARIRDVCALHERDAGAAAREVRAYWAGVETDLAARRDLAAFLVDQLERKDAAMTTTPDGNWGIQYAAHSDAGLVREQNQDTAYAGSRLLAVADGFGGSGGPASAAAVEALRTLEDGSLPAGDLLNVLGESVTRAGRSVREAAASDPAPHEAGTTLTAMLWTGSQLALVHIGDSRAYLLRDGAFFQITHDHTMVQSMLDEGRISPEEAASHPQRALLLRALTGADEAGAGVGGSGAGPGQAAGGGSGTSGGAPDLRLHDARLGDRYLLCSDGLSQVVPEDDVRRAVAEADGPETAVRELTALAHRHGAPDNVSCVVADVVELEG